jgi:hypothetical protein
MQTQLMKVDPLLCDFEMPLRATFYPLGFPLQIRTNSHEVLAAAEESWGRFPKLFSTPPLQMQIGVLEGGPAECPAFPVCREQRGLRSLVADAENFGVSDLKQGFAFAWFTRAAVKSTAYLRWHFIEGMAWGLLDTYITPVHAACVRFAGRGFLLCGDSGAGKSSLSFACAKSGWTFLSDDSSSLVRMRPEPAVIGNPHQFRFRESAMALFPELKRQQPTPRYTGELAIELPTASMPEITITNECAVDYIVFLDRGHSGSPRILPFPKQKALQWFEQVICCGDMPAHKAALRTLLNTQIFEMRYGDLASAVNCLEDLARRGA